MNKKTLPILACSFLGFCLNAQTFSPSVMSANGGESHTETLSLEWTLGEMAVDYIHTENMIISEGFINHF